MPAQPFWESLFDVAAILDSFGFGPDTGDVVELGCGYGTFTVPLAARIRGVVHAIDIEPEMVDLTKARARALGMVNVHAETRDVLTQGYGLSPAMCDAALLFNILHGEEPVAMLREASELVRPGGTVAVIHWRTDIATPRGPPAGIRPDPDQIVAWSATLGSLAPKGSAFLLRPWHYGIHLVRTTG